MNVDNSSSFHSNQDIAVMFIPSQLASLAVSNSICMRLVLPETPFTARMVQPTWSRLQGSWASEQVSFQSSASNARRSTKIITFSTIRPVRGSPWVWFPLCTKWIDPTVKAGFLQFKPTLWDGLCPHHFVCSSFTYVGWCSQLVYPVQAFHSLCWPTILF